MYYTGTKLQLNTKPYNFVYFQCQYLTKKSVDKSKPNPNSSKAKNWFYRFVQPHPCLDSAP